MVQFKKEQEKLESEIEDAQNQISLLEKQMIEVRQDKLFYKRKEDEPAFDRTLEKEIKIVRKIDFLSNEISILKNKLNDSKLRERKSIKTRSEMDKVLGQLSLGYSRVQASKNTGIPLSIINRWYDDGRKDNDNDSSYFYHNVKVREDFHHDFFIILKKEFKKQNKIHLMRSFVPNSYPQRVDRFYNEDSKLWFSMLKLRDSSSIYYFGLKGDNIPRLKLLFNNNYKKSNFRLIGDEVFVLLSLDNIDEIKKEFKLLSVKSKKELYYVSLGNLNGGKLSDKLELLVKKYLYVASNPFSV